MQLMLFEYNPSPKEVYEEFVQLKASQERVRKGQYSEISRLKGEVIELKSRLEFIEKGVCRR
jgi:hypothetical protein